MKGCVRCSIDEREHSEHDEGAQVPLWKLREPVCRKIQTGQYASNPRKEKSGYESFEERDYKGLQRARVANPTGQLISCIIFRECLRNHCNLIVQEREKTVSAISSKEFDLKGNT